MAKGEINSREQLWRSLDERMRNTYEDLQARQALESDSSLVKTYLLEAHVPSGAKGSAALSLLKKVVSRVEDERGATSRVRNTDDDVLFEVRSGSEPRLSLFIDTSNPRFWVAHSANNSVNVDRLVRQLVQSHLLD